MCRRLTQTAYRSTKRTQIQVHLGAAGRYIVFQKEMKANSQKKDSYMLSKHQSRKCVSIFYALDYRLKLNYMRRFRVRSNQTNKRLRNILKSQRSRKNQGPPLHWLLPFSIEVIKGLISRFKVITKWNYFQRIHKKMKPLDNKLPQDHQTKPNQGI